MLWRRENPYPVLRTDLQLLRCPAHNLITTDYSIMAYKCDFECKIITSLFYMCMTYQQVQICTQMTSDIMINDEVRK
jgi:hypothetical protein